MKITRRTLFFVVVIVLFLANHVVDGTGGISFKSHKAGTVPQPQNEVEGVDPRDAALLKSSSEGEVDTVKRILAAGANLECRDHKIGNTPLIWASFHGRSQVMKILVEKGANIEAISTDGYKTAILMAAYRGHTDAVVYLLRQGARIDHANDRGDTSLSLATYMNHTKTVEALLFRRADIRIKAKESHYTPVHIAASKGHDHILDMLLIDGIAARTVVNSKDKQGNTPFLLAAGSGKQKTVTFFLKNRKEHEIDVYAEDIIGNSAAMLAVNNGHIDTLKLLLDRTDLDIDDSNNRGETPLIRASFKGHAEILRYLLTKGADVDIRNSNREDATDVAVRADNKQCVILLEEYYRLSGKKRQRGHNHASGISLDSLKDTIDDDRFTTIGSIEL